MRRQNRISKAEMAFLDALEIAGVQFERQVRIAHFIVDAVCVDRNVVIEFDGDYWHSLPKIKAKDERKAAAIAWAGYRLIRVPEQAWMSDPEGTIARVMEAVWKL